MGAAIGVIFGWMALVDKTYMETIASPTKDIEASVPDQWLGYIAPLTPDGFAQGTPDTDFTRIWQTIWAILLTSTVMCFAYNAIKSPITRLNDDKILQAFLIATVYFITAKLNALFGNIGFNAAITAGYIMFETNQYEYPNQKIADFELNHYMWIYIVCSCAGGILGGILFNLHAKVIQGGSASSDEDDVRSEMSHDD